MHGFFVETQAEQNRFDLVFLDPAVFIGLQYAAGFFVHGRVRKVQVLLQVAERVFFRDVYRAAVEAFLPENHLEKCRLATTVAAHEAHALMVAYKHRGAIQKDLHAKGFRNVLNLNHGDKR